MMRKKKRCAEEEEEVAKNYRMKRIIKQQQQCSSSTSMIHDDHHQNKSWSDLDWDMLREINNKLCNYADAIGFRGVCKSWRAAGRLKTAGDVLLPWFISIDVDRFKNTLSYKVCEPQFLWEEEANQDPTIIKSDDDDKSSTSTSSAAIKISSSGTINMYDYFKQALLPPIILRYVDGWLHISVFTFKGGGISYFLFFSLAAPETSSFTLPPLNDSSNHLFLGLSTTTPDSPDCVFLTMWLEHDYTIKIGIFRHGDTHWKIISESVRACFHISRDMCAVFVHGVFYFVASAGLGSYDLATGALKLDRFSTPLAFSGIHSFFGLDGDLMLAYYPARCQGLCIRKYDWMNKLWVLPQTLGGRSLYLNPNGFPYVHHINYHGISSASKIYVQLANPLYQIDEYTFVYGCLAKCPRPARQLVRWPGLCRRTRAMWVPPHVLLRK